MFLQVVAVGLLVSFLFSIVCFRCSRRYRLLRKIPGPRGLPVLGNIAEVFTISRRLVERGREIRQSHGPTFVMWLGPCPIVFVCDPRDLEVVLNKSATLSKPRPYKSLELLLGYSLITANRSDWKRYHRIITPAFGLPTLKSFIPAFSRKSKVLVEALRAHGDGQPFDMMGFMMMCTLDIVTETSLGTDMNVLEDKRVDLVEGLRVAEDVIYHAAIQPWCWIPALMKMTKSYKAMADGVKVLWNYTNQIIAHKLENCDNANDHLMFEPSRGDVVEPADEEKKRPGFLEHVISCMKAEKISLKKVELRDNTMTVIVGGMGTGSIAMSIALMLMGLHQDVQSKVVDELEKIFEGDTERDVTYEDLTRMVYLEQVIKETLRLYPPLPVVGRVVEEEVRITGYTLPVGTIVGIPILFTHRDPGIFPDPEKFDPDRFSPENSARRHPYSFVPFLGGRRMCIGKKYAYMQMKTILSTVLRSYRVLPCARREEMEKLQFKMTLHLVNGYDVKLVPRKQ
ncbi:cytochrome P450 4C1-like [Bacillus rossius redtenbacheri]|uniref:cytochrome P450 4C1-like n=1 Tax=Bacillus rossius redtenbacheri TaxID=93214 RepID=UPI002FDD4AAC